MQFSGWRRRIVLWWLCSHTSYWSLRTLRPYAIWKPVLVNHLFVFDATVVFVSFSFVQIRYISRTRLTILPFHTTPSFAHHRLGGKSSGIRNSFVHCLSICALLSLAVSVITVGRHVFIDFVDALDSLCPGYCRPLWYRWRCVGDHPFGSQCKRWGAAAVYHLALHHWAGSSARLQKNLANAIWWRWSSGAE